MMRTLILPVLFLASCASTSKAVVTPESTALAEQQLALLANLEGKWYTADDSEPEPVLIYETMAMGHAVLETEFPGQPHQMATVYFIEGGELKLVHYCALGNRPRMVSRPTETADLYFELDGDGNLGSLQEDHMHSARFHFTGPDAMTQAWSFYSDGEPVDEHGSTLVRR